MISYFDLHLHTDHGSGDSVIAPQDMVNDAIFLGLRGVALTEHEGWGVFGHDFQAFDRNQDILLFPSLEVDTEYGHVLAFGIEQYEPIYRDLRALRRAADHVGGYLVVSHPFRGLFDGEKSKNLLFSEGKQFPETIEQAARHPIFSLVDDLEAFNGANSEQENRFALKVAHCLGWSGTGGSDAHRRQSIGRATTGIRGDIRSKADFLEALRAKAYMPIKGFIQGKPEIFDGAVIPFDLPQ